MLNSLESSFPSFFCTKMEKKFFLSQVVANVDSILHANVIGVLGKEVEFQADVIHYIKFDDAKDQLLVELGSNIPKTKIKNIYSKLPIHEECFRGWDSSLSMEFYRKYKKIKQPVEAALEQVSHHRDDFRGFPTELIHLTAITNLTEPDNPISVKESLSTIVDGSVEEMHGLRNRLMDNAKKWLSDQTKQFNENIFPLRQKALMDSIDLAQEEGSGRVVFFAGSSMGDPLFSPFTSKVTELFKQLSKSSFVILNPDRLDI